MTTKQAIIKAGTRRVLAELLGVSTQATYKWKRKLPEQRVDQLKQMRPDWFQAA